VDVGFERLLDLCVWFSIGLLLLSSSSFWSLHPTQAGRIRKVFPSSDYLLVNEFDGTLRIYFFPGDRNKEPMYKELTTWKKYPQGSKPLPVLALKDPATVEVASLEKSRKCLIAFAFYTRTRSNVSSVSPLPSREKEGHGCHCRSHSGDGAARSPPPTATARVAPDATSG